MADTLYTRRRFLAHATAAVAALPLAAQSLRSIAGTPPPLLGAAASLPALQQDPDFAQLLLRECDAITPESELKWTSLCRNSSDYDFTHADAFVDWAGKNHLQVRGHNLIWPGNGTPAWLRGKLNASNARSILEAHIRTVAGRYAGRLYAWDVLNEALNVWDKRPDGLCAYPWAQLLGQEYIDTAFHIAAQTDPHARLFWNEHYLESDDHGDEVDRALFLTHLRHLRKANVPIHGIGIQSHLFADKPIAVERMKMFLTEVRSLGYEIHLTEIDINDTSLPADPSLRDAACADTLSRYLDVVLPLAQPTAICFWSLTDRRNWLDWVATTQPKYHRADGLPHRPGLFDADLHPKPSYQVVASALRRYTPPR